MVFDTPTFVSSPVTVKNPSEMSAHVSCHYLLQNWLVIIIIIIIIIWRCPICLVVDLVPSVAVLVLCILVNTLLCHVPGSVMDFRQGDKLVSGLCL